MAPRIDRDRGFFVGPTLIDHVQPKMSVFTEEIFGPVLSMLRPKTLDEAIAWMNTVEYGNGASIFTTSGSSAASSSARSSAACSA